MRTAYRCRAYPDTGQKVMLARTFGCVRVVWNRTLAARQAAFKAEGKFTSYAATDRALTAMKKDPELEWLNEVSIEDLNVSGMVKNHSLARAISCTGWAEFRSMLTYKAQRYGRELVVIDRWYPSSKTCSACGRLLDSLSLGVRHWTCPGCGVLHDRDTNAAKNILAAGLALHACGGGVRRPGATQPQSPVNQETPGVSPGIPIL